MYQLYVMESKLLSSCCKKVDNEWTEASCFSVIDLDEDFVFKPGMRAWFLEIINLVRERRYVCVHVCVSVCLPLRALITSHVKHMRNNWIKQFYGFSVYMTLAVDKLNGRGLSNNPHCECLLKKTEMTWY